MKIIERYQAAKRNSTQDKIRKAGDAMAEAILGQMHNGQSSPYIVETSNGLKHVPDEQFLLRSARRAVEYLASAQETRGREIPLYNEQATILANHESGQKELTVIFSRPSEI